MKCYKCPHRSLRSLYGTDLPRNAMYGSATLVAAARDIALLFPDLPPSAPTEEMNIAVLQAALMQVNKNVWNANSTRY